MCSSDLCKASELVVAYGRHQFCGEAELGYVVYEICGRSSEHVAFRQHVPKHFAYAYYLLLRKMIHCSIGWNVADNIWILVFGVRFVYVYNNSSRKKG